MINFKVKYVIIIPARNEEKYIEKTINSIVNQTIIPEALVIVNDGSTDRTGEIIDMWADQYKWIRHIKRKDRGHREPGIGVMQAFYDGYAVIKDDDWEFIIKLDADLYFEKDYFERCFRYFKQDSTLGIGGGIILSDCKGKSIKEKCPKFHVRGATKIIRKRCWDEIGGFFKVTGWDTLDEVKANMLGWKTKSFKDLILRQQRLTGTAEGLWKDAVKGGRGSYICGYHPLFLFIRCIIKQCYKPFSVNPIGMFYGYWTAFFQRIQRIEDKALIRYLQKQQMRRIFGLKSIWK